MTLRRSRPKRSQNDSSEGVVLGSQKRLIQRSQNDSFEFFIFKKIVQKLFIYLIYKKFRYNFFEYRWFCYYSNIFLVPFPYDPQHIYIFPPHITYTYILVPTQKPIQNSVNRKSGLMGDFFSSFPLLQLYWWLNSCVVAL